MTVDQDVDSALNECFFAVGQTIGMNKRIEYEAVMWWHDRYRAKFLDAMVRLGNSWARDRRRVTAVGRYLALRALHHAGDQPTIDLRSAAKASAEIERNCHMQAEHEASAAPASAAN